MIEVRIYCIIDHTSISTIELEKELNTSAGISIDNLISSFLTDDVIAYDSKLNNLTVDSKCYDEAITQCIIDYVDRFME